MTVTCKTLTQNVGIVCLEGFVFICYPVCTIADTSHYFEVFHIISHLGLMK